jgi:perosamine synthetase
MNPIPNNKNTQYGYWMPTVIFDKKLNFDREKLLRKLKSKNIDARVFFYPLSSLPMFKKKKSNKVCYNIFERGINLPTFHDISLSNIKKVTSIIKDNLL